MSILIKGKEIPRGCAFCKIARRNGKKMVCPFSYEECDIRDPMSSDFRLFSCPLVPVPPHGRLGDLDALAARCDAPYWCVWLSEIEAAPTIIPPEEEGET